MPKVPECASGILQSEKVGLSLQTTVFSSSSHTSSISLWGHGFQEEITHVSCSGLNIFGAENE